MKLFHAIRPSKDRLVAQATCAAEHIKDRGTRTKHTRIAEHIKDLIEASNILKESHGDRGTKAKNAESQMPAAEDAE